MQQAARVSPSRRSRTRRGAAILAVVLALIALGALSAVIAQLDSTAKVEQGKALPARQAFYAAEAGLRLVTAEYNNAPASTDKAGLLGDIDGKTFTLNAATNEHFTMNVFSYGFRVTAVNNSSSPKTITARAVRSVPLANMDDPGSSALISFPVGGMISVQDEIGNDIPVTLVAGPGGSGARVDQSGVADVVTFYFSGDLPAASADLDFVNIAFESSGGATLSGDTVRNLPPGLSSFPPRNGRIGFQGTDKAYTYRTRTVESNGSVTLAGVEADGGSMDIADFRNAVIILRKTYAFQSVGSVGSGDTLATKTLVYYAAPKDESSTIDPDDVSDATVELTMEDFSDFNANDRNNLNRTRYESSQGNHPYYAAMYSSNQGHGGGSTLTSKFVKLDIDNFRDQWLADSLLHRLSYDVQIKIGSGYQLDNAAMGLCVRHHKDSGNDNFYAVSFMKYASSGTDYIPSGIKPPGLAGRILLVLWRQKDGVRDWIAYKDITDDVGTAPDQWDGDGQIVSDNTTMLIRVEEQYVQGVKVNRIKVFFGDGANDIPDGDRNLSAPYVPYDIVAGRDEGYWEDYYHWLWGWRQRWVENYVIYGGRKRYSPSWILDTGAYNWSWDPSFPPLDIDDWSAGVDYFSFIETSPPTYTAGGTSARQCTWDGFNSSRVATFTGADIRILSDGGTIRSKEFVTPNDSFPSNSEQRAEVALHAFGYMRNANHAATFDDLAIQFLLYN
ncbi:hypothetical protein [Desulfocurvus sp. DL9XJH121]